MSLPNKFPSFNDGDTLISLAPSVTFQLHSAVLRSASTKFEELLDEEYAATPSKKTKGPPPGIRFRIVLIERLSEGQRIAELSRIVGTPKPSFRTRPFSCFASRKA